MLENDGYRIEYTYYEDGVVWDIYCDDEPMWADGQTYPTRREAERAARAEAQAQGVQIGLAPHKVLRQRLWETARFTLLICGVLALLLHPSLLLWAAVVCVYCLMGE